MYCCYSGSDAGTTCYAEIRGKLDTYTVSCLMYNNTRKIVDTGTISSQCATRANKPPQSKHHTPSQAKRVSELYARQRLREAGEHRRYQRAQRFALLSGFVTRHSTAVSCHVHHHLEFPGQETSELAARRRRRTTLLPVQRIAWCFWRNPS